MKTGVGIRSSHFEDALLANTDVGFFEAHSENYFGDSLSRKKLIELAQIHPISLHGVGLSLGRADGLDENHLQELKYLVDDINPLFVSEHLSWSAYAHTHVPDLLPLPLTVKALNVMREHIEQMQEFLQLPILIENPSNYLLFDQLQIPEPEFLNNLAKTTGCGLLLDINNVYVSASNLGKNPKEYLESINPEYVKQYHLAGYTEHESAEDKVLIDTHNQQVHKPVWNLYEFTLQTLGDKPTLIEWDADLPEFNELLLEAHKADDLRSNNATKPFTETVSNTDTDSNVHVKNTDSQESSELEELQDVFISGLFSNGAQPKGISNAFEHRYWIYQNNVQQALIGYLASVFEACSQLVGEAFFNAMAKQYVINNHPESGDIHKYGADFSQFIDGFKPAQSVPYLADVASLEWARHRAYYANSFKAFTSQVMSEFKQEEQLALTLGFNESVCLLESNFPVNAIWRKCMEKEPDDSELSLEDSENYLLICKHENTVQVIDIEPNTYLFLKELVHRKNILSAIQEVVEQVGQEPISQGIALAFEYELLVQTKDLTKN